MSLIGSRFETLTASYLTKNVLGEGGAGRVLTVVDESGAEFALKTLKSEGISTDRLKRFRNELAFCKRRVHPLIVCVLDDGFTLARDIKVPFYVMPVYRTTLRSLMRESLSGDDLLRVFSRLLDGVEAAHLCHVYHRDLKPENVLIGDTPESLVVADFGVAHFGEDSLWTAVETRANERLANFAYAAPEQKIRGAKVDHRADIFALGLILNEMFTGEVPYGKSHKTIGNVAAQFAYLDALVDQMLSQDPASRPNDIASVKGQLIGRSLEFVSQQKLDTLRSQVVSVRTPDDVPEITFAHFDYQQGQLLITLEPGPPPGWISCFNRPTGNYASLVGYGPDAFFLNGNVLAIRAPADLIEAIVRYAKGYAEMATQELRRQRAQEAILAEQAAREANLAKVAEEEERLRVIRTLKNLNPG